MLENVEGMCGVDYVMISIQLPGNRKIYLTIAENSSIGDLKSLAAKEIGVKEQNWGIYIPSDNRLKIIDNSVKLNQIDQTKLHFYPNVKIR
jgi:hypothetical protein